MTSYKDRKELRMDSEKANSENVNSENVNSEMTSTEEKQSNSAEKPDAENETAQSPEKPRKKKRWIVVKAILIVLVLLLIGGLAFWKYGSADAKKQLLKFVVRQEVVKDIIAEEVKEDYDEHILDTEYDKEEVVVNNEEVKEKLTGYQNIILFGIDARGDEFDQDTRSDTMMIVSINNDTGAVRMISLYRDTYLKVLGLNGNYIYTKVNAAYSYGGAQEAVSTLNTNLDLNISDYVVVNFSGLINIIDMMDGVDVYITEREMTRINEIVHGMTVEDGGDVEEEPVLDQYGDVHLNGIQATAFCRIRDVTFTDGDGVKYDYDFGRTARQRYVIGNLVAKAKASGVSSLLSLAKQILNMNTKTETFIKTSLDYDQIMDLIPIVIDYNIEGSSGFPFTLATPTIDGASLVVAEGLSYNVSQLHKFLFDDAEYQPSDTVKEISDYILNYTNVPEVQLTEEDSQ